MVDRLLEASTAGEAMSSRLAPFDLLETLRKAAADLPGHPRKRLQTRSFRSKLPPALGHRAGLASVPGGAGDQRRTSTRRAPAPIVLSAESDERTVLFRVADRGIGIPGPRTEHFRAILAGRCAGMIGGTVVPDWAYSLSERPLNDKTVGCPHVPGMGEVPSQRYACHAVT